MCATSSFLNQKKKKGRGIPSTEIIQSFSLFLKKEINLIDNHLDEETCIKHQFCASDNSGDYEHRKYPSP